jgi:SAM-dependent methyltransferase
VISSRLSDLVRCPDCAGALTPGGQAVRCDACGRSFAASAGYLDLRPSAAFDERTRYVDEALHVDARHETIAPPLLGSKVRQDMLRHFLALGPGDRAIDLGCGSGRTLAWNAGSGAQMVGIDLAPYFAREALAGHDLLLGDLRRLPIRDGAFTKAWTLDVVEHVSAEALADVLAEAHRVLAPGGALFVYSHVRRNSWIAGGVRLANRLAAALERAGLVDIRQERLRKSDHLNPLADHAELAAAAGRAGFRIERITYYTPILGAFVENVLVRIAERFLAGRATPAGGSGGVAGAEPVRAARQAAQARLRRRGPLFRTLVVVSWVMKLDVVLFGRFRSGPFFALLRKTGAER